MPKFRITKGMTYVVTIECEAIVEALDKDDLKNQTIDCYEFEPTKAGQEARDAINQWSECYMSPFNAGDLRFTHIEEITKDDPEWEDEEEDEDA